MPFPFWILGTPYLFFYEVVVEWLLNVELRSMTKIGPNLRIYHGYALVVHEKAIIGTNCTLRHSTTIGNKSHDRDDSPRIGDHVDIGSNAVLIGAISIGDGATIGAGSVVLKNVPAGATVAGNPARVIHPKSKSIDTDA